MSIGKKRKKRDDTQSWHSYQVKKQGKVGKAFPTFIKKPLGYNKTLKIEPLSFIYTLMAWS